MAITTTLLTSGDHGFGDGGTLTFTTASITPGADCALVLLIGSATDSDPSGQMYAGTHTVTSSGSGPTWTKRSYSTPATAYGGQCVIWTAVIGGTSPGSFTVTCDFNASHNPEGWAYTIHRCTGHDTSTTFGGFVTTGGDASTGNGAVTVTLSAAPASDDVTVAQSYAVENPPGSGATFGTGTWTETVEGSSSTRAHFNTGYRTGSTSTSVPWSDVSPAISAASSAQAAIVVKAAAGGPIALTVADAAHAHSADNIGLSSPNSLAPANAAHAHTAGNVDLTQAHVLTVANALHDHTSTTASFSGLAAVRFDAGTDGYSRSAAGLLGAFTFSCWFYRVAAPSPAHYETIIGADMVSSWWTVNIPETTPFHLYIETSSGNIDSGLAPALDTWYYVAATCSAGTGRIYYAAAGAPTLTTVFGAVGAIADTWSLRIGNTTFVENINGRIAAVKIWNAALTQAELETERPYYEPQRTADLWAWYSFAAGPSTVDESGNGRTLTASGTLTSEAGPPILFEPLAGLTVDDALHGHSAGNVPLSPNIVLVIANAFHGHTAATPTLAGVTVTLAVASAIHTQTATTPSFGALRYPVTVSARKWFDQTGNVYLLRSMASWAMGQNCTTGEITAALEGLAGRGFNGVTVAPFGVAHNGTYSPLTNDAGQAFFTGTAFQSALGPAWTTIDHLMSEATRLGMTVVFTLFISWGPTGMQPQLNAAYSANPANPYNYGFAVASRYAAYPNVVWHVMGDDDFNYGSTTALAIDQVYRGIRTVEGSTNRMITAEPHYARTSYSQFISQEGVGGAGYEWFRVDLNTPIREPSSEQVNVSDAVWNEVGATSEAHWLDEPMYVHSSYYGGNHLQQVRERNYATFLRGGVGINFGNEYWWPHGSEGLFGGTRTDWLTELNDVSTIEAQHAWNLIRLYCGDATFLPATFISTGLGVGDTKAAAGMSGNVAIAYFPTNRSVIVDTTVLAGTGNVRLRWYDPTNGTFTTIADSETQNPLRAVAYPAAHGDATTDYVLLIENVSVTITAVADTLHGHTATEVPAGTQTHVLTVAAAAHTSSSANAVLSIDAVILNVAHSLHSHSADNVTLSQTHQLVITDAAHAHNADNVTLVVTVTLVIAPANILHAHTADNVDILVGGTNLAAHDTYHAHGADGLDLGQIHTIVVANCLHAHTATNVNLVNPSTFIVIGDARRTLTVLDAERTAEATDAPD